MNTASTNPTKTFSRWTHFSRTIRKSFGVSLSAGLTIAVLLANFMVGCKDEGPGILTVCVTPTVIRTSPSNGTTNEPLNKIGTANESAIAAIAKKTSSLAKTSAPTASASAATVKVISATFSTPMDPNSITTSTFTVWQGTTPILGGVSYTDTTAIFVVPNGLDPNLSYTCTISTGARDLAGTGLAEKYVWIFSTATAAAVTAPTVSSTDPVNAATGVVLNKQLAAAFSKTMDASTLTSATFTMKRGTTPIQGFVSYSGTTAIFAPSSNLAPSTVYTATITTGVKDLAGNAMASNFVWSFTTGAAVVVNSPTVSYTNPANAATGVALNQKLAATFSTTMDASTFTAPTFTLKQGATSIQGFVSYSGTTAIFAPAGYLLPNTAYTATITTDAKDLAGNALANDFVWSFTTGAAAVVTPPTVSFTDPVNVATGVALNQKIAATFSTTMDASTFTTPTFTLKQGATSIQGFVSYTGTTAIFAPASNLAPSTVYTATITTGVKDLAGNALANDFVWSFTTGAAVVVTPPTISSTDPVNVATGVALNQKIAATFSTTMDASTFTTPSFTLKQGATSVSGFVSYSGRTAIFAPASNLLPNLTYSVTITTTVKDLAGNALANNYVWSFTTGAAVVVTPPTVSSTDPVNIAIGVALNQKLAATFSKTMNASTITTSTFTLMQGITPIQGFVSYSGTTAIFAPASNLAPSTVYTAMITTEVKDLAGNALANNYAWNFTTGAAVVVTPPTISSTDPLNVATGVALNQKIAATFSETMDASTIHTSTFTLKQGTTSVSGFVSYTGTTATFAPASNLAANTVYTATITTEAQDLAGNALANNFVWSFTTGAAVVVTPPTVSSTDPANIAIGVALNQKIAATFSKTMNASTITTSTFTLMQGITPIQGFVSYSGVTAIFAPASNLIPSTVYTATITTEAKDLAGNALANNYAWNFTTGAAVVVIPPIVSSTDPVNTATGVALNQKIAATFSKTMDASTFTTPTFTLKQGTTSIQGFVSYTGTTAIFAPASNLAPSTVYTATITTGVKDLAGNALAADYVWSFTTGTATVVNPPTVSSTDPVNTSTSVALNKQVAATFSRTMDASTIQPSIFTLKQGTTSVTGFVSYSGTTAIFTPASNLAANTVYTATITTGAKDLAGNALASNYVWSFTTGAAAVVTPPTVISTDPANGAICVALNKHIDATFSRTMNASSITTATFTLMEMQGTTFVSGTVSYVGTTATFTPLSNLKPNTTYIATITTGVKDSANCGCNAMASNYVWSFTTIVPYTVALSSNPSAGGTTSGGGTFNSCSSVTVTATPNTGYTFTNWTEGVTVVSTTANYTFTLNGNRTLVANFTLIPYTVTLSSNPALGGTTNGGGTFNYGTSVTVAATPNTGYTFKNWTEGVTIVSTNASYIFTISGNRTLVANFTAIPYTVTLSSNPALGGTTNGGGTFNFGTSVTVTATSSAGYTFTNWTENGTAVSTNASYIFTLSGNRTLVANFTSISYTVALSSSPGAGGTTSGGGTYNSGASVTALATPNAGYSFTNWTEGATVVSTIASYTFTLSGNRTLVANFSAIPQNSIHVSPNPAAGGITEGGGNFNSGSSVTVLATPNAGYTFTNWTEGVLIVSTNASYTFILNANRLLVANFSLIQYTVALSSNPAAGGTTGGGGTFNTGASVTVTATPAIGYTFTNWTEGVVIVSTNASYTFTLSGNRTLVANFTALPSGPAPVDLLSAGNFAILAGSGVSNTGVTTHIYGDVGSFPTATIVGLLAGNVTGTLYTVADPLVGTAKTDLTTAYNDAQGRSLNAISLPGQLGGLTLAPGLYVNSTSTGISGTGANAILTLDAGGNPNAVWIFKMGSTLITDAGTSIVLAGGASWKNVYWSVGTSATLGTNSIFYGNILADQAITLTTGATLYGRALTRIAAVTLDAGTIDKR